jgi:hypothetical protein
MTRCEQLPSQEKSRFLHNTQAQAQRELFSRARNLNTCSDDDSHRHRKYFLNSFDKISVIHIDTVCYILRGGVAYEKTSLSD